MPESESPGGGTAAVVILTRDPELQTSLREEATLGGRPLRFAGTAEEALEAAEPASLLVVDAAAEDPATVRAALAERAPGAARRLLVLLGPAGDPRSDPGGAPHFLARPLTAAAVLAYADRLLAAEAPALVRPRVPAAGGTRRLYREAVEWVEGVLETTRQGEVPELSRGRSLAEELLTSLLRSNSLVLRSLEPHGAWDLASHSVNVAILCGKIAGGLAWEVERVLDVIRAGLVHDVGMARIPQRVLLKQGPLNEAEREEVRRHPIYGAEILSSQGPEWEAVARAVRQEHERLNGQGYPAGLEREAIDPLARVIGVADVFEALSHPRSHRSPFTAFDALQKVVGMQREYFAPDVVSALVNEISSFPLDSYVQLNTGEIGKVVGTNPDNLLRPRVLVLWDAAWRPLAEPRPVDLEKESELTITRALHEMELPIT